MINVKNKRVLVVDDLAPMRQIIKGYLNDIEITEVHIASNGEEALKILNTYKIDLLITDWNMPIINGLELIQTVRQSKTFRFLPIIMFTAETTKESINMALGAGVNEFMVKPFNAQTFYNKIESVLTGKSPISRISTEAKTAFNETLKKNTKIKPHLNTNKPSILVVDDMPLNIDVMLATLKSNYQVKVATNGKKALEIALSDKQPNLIILDIMMPEMDGMEVCQKLKENSITADIPIIFLSSKTDSETIIKGFELGAVDYISKPIEPEILRMRVKNQLQLQYAKNNLSDQLDTALENNRLREDVQRITHHDLKNSLSIILHRAQQLNGKTLSSKIEQKNIGATIISAGSTILEIVNSSLNLYKMETDTYQFIAEEIDMLKILEHIKNDFQILMNEKQITLDISHENKTAIACGEELLCYSILSNLIKNAIEASISGEIIKISITQWDNILITIHNSAVVPEVIKEHFFDKYVSEGKKEGTGLGTYSAKLMAEVQNSSLTFSSSKNDGTRLFFELPACKGET